MAETRGQNWGVHFDTGTSAQRNYKKFAYFDTGTTLWELLANMHLPILTQELQDSYWVLVSGENHKDGAMKGSVGQCINVLLHSKILMDSSKSSDLFC